MDYEAQKDPAIQQLIETKEREKKIKNRFPEQFGKAIGHYGISLPLGWFTLWENSCLAIKTELENSPGVSFEWTQVKEKFGVARFYFTLNFSDRYTDFDKDTITVKLSQIVLSAENASGNICQDCGLPGRMRGGGWIRTLCDDHAKERGVV